MKKFVILAIFLLSAASIGGNVFSAHAAQQPLSSADAAILNQELVGMKTALLQMQDQLQAQSAAPVSVVKNTDVPSDLVSLNAALISLRSTLASFQVNLQMNGSAVTPAEKIVVRDALNGIGADLVSMQQILTETRVPSAVALAGPGASGNTVSAQPATSVNGSASLKAPDQGVQMAQVSAVAPWRQWAARNWPIGIGVIVILLAAIWMWYAKSARSVSDPVQAHSVAPASSSVPVSPSQPQGSNPSLQVKPPPPQPAGQKLRT